MKKIKIIKTKRFNLKPLVPKHASQRYLKWFKDRASTRFISAAKKTRKIKDLQKYIKKFSCRNDCIFLRILTKKSNYHIGNIKFHPINLEKKTAVMGILVGESSWRGKGVAKEVIQKTASYLREKSGIKEIYLGVARNNSNAIRAYQKAGFNIINRWNDGKKPRKNQKIMVKIVD